MDHSWIRKNLLDRGHYFTNSSDMKSFSPCAIFLEEWVLPAISEDQVLFVDSFGDDWKTLRRADLLLVLDTPGNSVQYSLSFKDEFQVGAFLADGAIFSAAAGAVLAGAVYLSSRRKPKGGKT